MENIPIKEWKLKYGRIFKTRIEDKDIFFRLLTIDEVKFYEKNILYLWKNINSIILNNESLSLPGSKYKLSDFIFKNSFPHSDEEMNERVLKHKFAVKDDFLNNLIAKLCSVFISYTPDTLKDKNIDQLLELTAIAETMTGKPLLKSNAKGNNRVLREPIIQQSDKFSKPDVQSLMDESTDLLAQEMAKHGKTVKKLSEVKKEKEPDNLTDLQRDMREFNLKNFN